MVEVRRRFACSEQGILQRSAWLAQKFRPAVWINVANVTVGAHCRRRSPFYGLIIGMALVGLRGFGTFWSSNAGAGHAKAPFHLVAGMC
jgi:hypothetical protein